MAASEGDTALKNKGAGSVIEESLAGGGGLKTAGFLAVMVNMNLHARDG
ncbi:hypothetical protein [Prosthecobacter fluviatilis]|uniref:Uncharacterized protein n=1 Tax=Prosthecobacter fluviatilis TaxID=445931 RepID=A0ABW0KLC9_9BACT